MWHLYVVRVSGRDTVLHALHAAGIGAGIHYPTPVHLTGAFQHVAGGPGSFPVAEQLASEILSLPIYPEISPQSRRGSWTHSGRRSDDCWNGCWGVRPPSGLCESDEVGAGTRIWAFAHVLPGAQIGRDCNICDGAFVETGAVLGDRVTVKNGTLIFTGVTCEDDVFLGPNVLFTNDLRPRAELRRGPEDLVASVVRRGATLGAGTVVVCGVEVGHYAFAAAGSVITTSIPPHAFVAGNPARQKGWACACGHRLSPDLHCGACSAAYVRQDAGLRPLGPDERTVQH